MFVGQTMTVGYLAIYWQATEAHWNTEKAAIMCVANFCIQNTSEGDLFRFSWVGPSPSCDQAGSIQPDRLCWQHCGHGLPYHWNATSHNPLEKGRRGVVPGGLSDVHHGQRLPGNPLRQGHWHIFEL